MLEADVGQFPQHVIGEHEGAITRRFVAEVVEPQEVI